MRPWRNNNPGDLRCVPLPGIWEGQVGRDNGPGGPFAIFRDRAMGWRALAVCLLTYQDAHDLRTVRQIINRWAPPAENQTSSYISAVAAWCGFTPDEPLDLRQPSILAKLAAAIAREEGGAVIVWPESEVQVGISRALAA